MLEPYPLKQKTTLFVPSWFWTLWKRRLFFLPVSNTSAVTLVLHASGIPCFTRMLLVLLPHSLALPVTLRGSGVRVAKTPPPSVPLFFVIPALGRSQWLGKELFKHALVGRRCPGMGRATYNSCSHLAGLSTRYLLLQTPVTHLSMPKSCQLDLYSRPVYVSGYLLRAFQQPEPSHSYISPNIDRVFNLPFRVAQYRKYLHTTLFANG